MLSRRNANLLAGRKPGLLPVPERVNDFIVELESGKPSCQLENALIVARTPVERVRFVSSGTEATMSAIRLARGATGRDLVVKFAGCYHGHVDPLLAEAGSGVATLAVPGTSGVPASSAGETLVLPYNDRAAVQAAFEAHGPCIACLITEATPGNMGIVPPEPGFNAFLAETCRAHGALFISDEVMTGFRATAQGGWGLDGATEGWVPDLMTFGKVMGGGFPAAAFGGRADLMAHLAPEGRVYQAGTLSGNPLAMAAGIATISHLQANAAQIYPQLEATSKALAEGVAAEAAKANVPVTTNRVGAMWTWFFTPDPVTNYEQATKSDTAAFGRFHRAMLNQGIWLPPSQFEAAFLSTAHGQAEIQATITAARNALAT